MKKQFDYADRKAIPFLSINGGNEMENAQIQVKNLSSGVQKSFDRQDIEGIAEFLK